VKNSTASVIMRRSPLVEAFNPFGKLTCGDTPLTTDHESGQFFARDQAFYRSLRHPQQLSDLAESEQLQRIITISFHRRWANEQCHCHDRCKV